MNNFSISVIFLEQLWYGIIEIDVVIQDVKKGSVFVTMVYGLLSCIVTLLLFILTYDILPDMGWPYKFDKILTLIAFAALVLMMVKLFRPIVFIFILTIGCWLFYKVQTTNYDLMSFYNDSREVLSKMQTSRNGSFVYVGYKSLSTDEDILNAIDYNNPVVRDFAVEAINTNFRKEQREKGRDSLRVLIQSFAVFKKIRTNWNYISDPAKEEYFAKASETVKLLAGDCDDYSIVIAGCIKSIGGQCRLLCVNGHIYPELLIGSRSLFNKVAPLITQTLFSRESKGQNLNYHEDEKGNIWLNLDYTAYYPGGKFMSSDVIEFIYP